MQVFKPFRANFHRQQKYYSQKRINDRAGSIFNLPKQVIQQPSNIVITPHFIPHHNQKIGSLSHQNKTTLDPYQSNLKKTIKKTSIDILNKKALEKAALSIIVTDKNKKPTQKISRNKSVDNVNNKNMSFQTLNILYRTIIQTKVKTKPKLKFEVNAKKLPILQKSLLQSQESQDIKRNVQVLVRNTPFSNQKRIRSNIKENNDRSIQSKKQKLRSRTKNLSNFSLSKQNEDFHIFSHRRRFDRRPSTSMGMNEIIPWRQIQDVEQGFVYHPEQFIN